MSKNNLLWTQKANNKGNNISHFINFVYEFIGARFTLIAFIALFNFAAIGLGHYDDILTAGIAVFLFYLISDAFNVFWIGINLEYNITKQGIIYKWGVFRSHELAVSYEDMIKISAIKGKSDKRNALIFENSLNIINGDYGFSKELLFNELSFENVQNIDSVIDILKKESGFDIAIKEERVVNSIDTKLRGSYLYLKFLQLVSLVFLYFATLIALNLLDNNLLPSNYVMDKVVSQEIDPFNSEYFYDHLKTEKGYSFILEGRSSYDILNEKVELWISPIFNRVVRFKTTIGSRQASLKNGYIGGINIIFKLAALILSLLCGSYIFYKRCYIHFEDLTIILLLPIAILLISFLIFH